MKILSPPRPAGRASSTVGTLLFVRTVRTPLGDMLAVASERGLRLLEFAEPIDAQDTPPALGARLGSPLALEGHPLLTRIAAELDGYFAGRLRTFTVPLDVRGTPFQERVWAQLQRIEHGRTCSYAELARSIGQPTATRAVASANARNPLAIVIPCHRVIASSGELGGYAGQVWRKQRLLDLERRA